MSYFLYDSDFPGQRSLIGRFEAFGEAITHLNKFASQRGWEVLFCEEDTDHPGCADAFLVRMGQGRRMGETKVVSIEFNPLVRGAAL